MAPNASTSNAQKSSRKPVDSSTKNNNDLEKDAEDADLSNYYAEDDPDYLDYDDTYFPGYEEYFQEGYEE